MVSNRFPQAPVPLLPLGPEPRDSAAPPGAVWLRPRQSCAVWREIGAPRSVLQWIRFGVPLEFQHELKPFRMPEMVLRKEDLDWARLEAERMVELGAWEEWSGSEPAFLSSAFIVHGAKRRVVIDLRHVNAALVERQFRYETLREFGGQLNQGDSMISFDLKDGYHHIAIQPQHRKYLAFRFAGRTYRCAALPFGLRTAPYVFTKTMRVLVKHWRASGVRVLPYLDDFLFATPTHSQASLLAEQVDLLLHRLGLIRNVNKGVWTPVTQLQHLGVTVDTMTMRFTLPPQRLQKITSLAVTIGVTAAQEQGKVPRKWLECLLGHMSAAKPVLPRALLMSRNLQLCLASRAWAAEIRLSSAARSELHNLRKLSQEEAWSWIQPVQPQAVIFTDASGEVGWGAEIRPLQSQLVLEVPSVVPAPAARTQWSEDQSGVRERAMVAAGAWSQEEAVHHINVKEALAVLFALRAFRPILISNGWHDLAFAVDSATVLGALRRLTSRSERVRCVVDEIWSLCRELDLRFSIHWIASASNPADQWSRIQDHEDWKLDPSLFQWACRRFNTYPTIDWFATANNRQVPRFCSRFYQPEATRVDALIQPLQEEVGWANPPWSLIHRFLMAVKAAGAVCLVCLPYWRSASWWPLALQLLQQYVVIDPGPNTFRPRRLFGQQGVGTPRWNVVLGLLRA